MSEVSADHAALEVVDLHKSFGDVEVIRGVSLSAHKGDVISILGASGSGKSTFLRCINLLEIPNAGDVFVAGAAPVVPHVVVDLVDELPEDGIARWQRAELLRPCHPLVLSCLSA